MAVICGEEKRATNRTEMKQGIEDACVVCGGSYYSTEENILLNSNPDSEIRPFSKKKKKTKKQQKVTTEKNYDKNNKIHTHAGTHTHQQTKTCEVMK